MKFKILGLVLVIVGLLGLAGGLVNYSTGEPVGGQFVEKTLSPVSGALVMFVFPVVGVLAVFAGIGFLVIRKKTIESI